jgi:hypothetical protein
MKSHNPSEIIRQVAESFPCLGEEMISCAFPHGEFCPRLLCANMRYWSHGEQLVGAFLLTLWNSSQAKKKGRLFDPFEALAVWDMGNRAAYTAWCQNPIYP